MTRWLLILFLLLSPPSTIAFDMPYGVQDPMLGSAGWMPCAGGEMGYWGMISRHTPDGRSAVYLVITEIDLVDPAQLICVVPPDRKVMVMEPGKKL